MLDLSVPQRSLNRLLFFNILTVVVILSVTFFACNVSELLNIVHNPLLVTKIACSYLVIANASLAAKLDKNGPSSAKSTKSTRSQVMKVAQGAGYLFAASCVAHFVAILFGAPFTQSVSETFHFASLLSATTVLPCVSFMGPSISVWLLTWNQRRKEAPLEWSIFLSSAGAVIGAWLGAFPIPLDWDRPWQVWPVSCVIGTLIGYCVGLLVSSAFLIQRIQRQRKSKAG